MAGIEHGIILPGALEIRARGRRGHSIRGRFPYGATATVRNVGRARKERFAPDSMSWQVKEFGKLQAELSDVLSEAVEEACRQILIEQLEDALERRNTHLLIGHSYDRPIADMRSGTLDVKHSAVEIEARLPEDRDEWPSWVRDAVLAVKGRQLRGISPGFQVTAKGAERLVPEDGPGDSMVREILDAVVFEYSLVSRPAYASTTVDARAAEPGEAPGRRRLWL